MYLNKKRVGIILLILIFTLMIVLILRNIYFPSGKYWAIFLTLNSILNVVWLFLVLKLRIKSILISVLSGYFFGLITDFLSRWVNGSIINHYSYVFNYANYFIAWLVLPLGTGVFLVAPLIVIIYRYLICKSIDKR